MFEPLVVGLILPYLSVAPWTHRCTPSILAVGSTLSGLWSTVLRNKCSLLWEHVPGVGYVTLLAHWIVFTSTYLQAKTVSLG